MQLHIGFDRFLRAGELLRRATGQPTCALRGKE
jgi:hypothetical protein